MTKSCSRRIVVLRDIPSNLIEEAILVIKTDNTKSEKPLSEKISLDKKRDFLVIKEAETIIDNYINNRETLKNNKNAILYGRKWYNDFFLNMGLIMGIGLFIYLIVKMF